MAVNKQNNRNRVGGCLGMYMVQEALPRDGGGQKSYKIAIPNKRIAKKLGPYSQYSLGENPKFLQKFAPQKKALKGNVDYYFHLISTILFIH
jgi:hypothetical protein